ncbi:hypothetical protein COV82_03390 [Candidatus Peregrinibacteria bacterium CG11_big_fil_rev_8_21_14_0_20_46_8]|nr:MAG: hypothetical protein COV82_03390 [Candidatus Peregrinibacteria bacterium CG11_big_fil_rev_8_21_14_0_20_46_8]
MAHLMAKTYHAFGRQVTAGDDIQTPDTDFEYSDKEGYLFAPTGTHTMYGNAPHNKEHYRTVFINYFAEQLHELDQKEKYSRIFIFMPPDIKNSVYEKLSSKIKPKVEIIEGNFVNHQLPDLLGKLTMT